MVLASQSGRVGFGQRYVATSSRRRRRLLTRPVVILALLLMVAGVLLAIGPWRGGSGSSAGAGAVGDDRESVAAAPSGAGSSNQPATVSIGSGGDSSNRSGVAATPGSGNRDAGTRNQETASTGRTTATNPTGSRSTEATLAPPRPTPVPIGRSAAPTAPEVRQRVQEGMAALNDGRLVTGRYLLSTVLPLEGELLSAEDARLIRERLTAVNRRLLFSREIDRSDPLVETYRIVPGDNLQSIARRFKITPELIARINNISNPNRIVAGQEIKVIRGPFRLEVIKSAFRMDVLLDDAVSGQTIYVESFPVGLGREDRTPPGRWRVSQKQIDPDWRDPDTHQHFRSGDPANPIGTRWIRLQGLDPSNENLQGYGIHGTIDPSSIRRQESNGCVRLINEQVEYLFDLLSVGHSEVLILPHR